MSNPIITKVLTPPVSFSVSQVYFMKDYMMGLLQMLKIMSSNEADELLC